jgi:hypothetical protein
LIALPRSLPPPPGRAGGKEGRRREGEKGEEERLDWGEEAAQVLTSVTFGAI